MTQHTGQHYIAALRQQFPHAIIEESWQTDTQATLTVKTDMLPEVVEYLYYQQGGWLSVLFGNDERPLCGSYAVYYVLSMERGTKCWITVKALVDAATREYPSSRRGCPPPCGASAKSATCMD